MSHHRLEVLAACLLLAACNAGETPELPSSPAAAVNPGSGLVRKSIPAEDPGPPIYARATPIMGELFQTDEWLVIPFYRQPTCIPADFNVLDLFDFPGPGGPGAFGCPLVVNGALLIEPDAPLGTFPRHAVLEGSAVPIWLVSRDAFAAAAADGIVTFAQLQALDPVRGTADRFHEVLMPRPADHRIEIRASGRLEDGRRFDFGVVHHGEVTRSIHLRLR